MPFCVLFAGLGSIIEPAVSLFFSYYLALLLSSPFCPLLRLSFYLKLCGRSGRNCLLSPPVLSDYNGSPDTRFSRIVARLMSWPYGEHCFRPLQLLVVSRVHSCLFSAWRRAMSSKFFNVQDPSVSTGGLVLPSRARCALSHLRCGRCGLLLGSCLSRIGRIENPSCSACGHSSQDTPHLILHCPATNSLCCSLFGNCLFLCGLWSRPWGVARLLGLHGFPPCPHPSEGVA